VLSERRAATTLLALAVAAAGAVYFVTAAVPGSGAVRDGAFVLLAALVLVHMVRHADPAWLISAGLAATMFSGHWQLLGLNTTVVPDRALLVTGLLAVMLRLGPSRDRPPLRLGLVHFVLAGAIVYALVSALLSQTLTNRDGVFALIDQFGLIPFVVFATAPVVFRTVRQRNILLGSLVATGGYLGVTGLFEKLKLTALVVPSYVMHPAVGVHFGRARGPFVEAGADGLAMYACAVAAALAFALWRERWQRIAALAVSALCLVGVLLTETRGIWLGAVVASLLVLAAAPALRRFLIPVAVGGACLVLVALAVIPGLAASVNGRSSDQSPVWERENSDKAGLRMVAARPLAGFGWYHHNQSAEPYFRQAPTIPLSGEKAGLHNVFLIYAVDLGLVGFGVWLAGAALAFGGAVSRRGPPDLDMWRLGLAALVASYITYGLTGPLEYTYPTLLLWLWAGVAYRPRRETSSAAGAWGDHLERLPGEAA